MRRLMGFLTVFFALGLAPFSSSPKVVSETQELMGTLGEIQVLSKDVARAQHAIQDAFSEMRRIENIFSLWIPESELCQLNNKASRRPVKTSPWMKDLLKISLRVSQETEGAFDLTIMPLATLWKEKFKREEIPLPGEVQHLRHLVNYKNIKLDRRGRVFFRGRGVKLDFGGIAKGYAVDRAVQVLRDQGFKNFIVGLSGDLFISGHKSLEEWKIGIKNPRVEGELIEILNVQDRAISTSGDYEQYLDVGNRRYHHLIDPRTGYPARGCISTTVLAPSSTLADAYSTALFILGPKKAEEFVRTHSDLKVIMIVESQGELKKLQFGK